MLYEIINPSDPYTIAADDPEVAAVACFLLGNGQYAFKPIDGPEDAEVPILILVSADEWCEEKFGKKVGLLIADVINNKADALIACLESCLIGRERDRREFEQAIALIDDPKKREEFRAARHDLRRSSLNDIGGRALQLAVAVRKKAAERPKE